MKNFTFLPRGLMTCAFALFFFIANAQIPEGYYSSAEGKSGDSLKAALYEIIKGHIEYPYTSSTTDVWDILKETDRDPNNPNNVIGIYSDFSMDAAAEYNNGDGWSREHVWAKSRGDFGTTSGAGTDVHHLRAADISTNSARSNRTFAECSEQYIDGSGTYQGPTESFTSSTEFIWKPQADVKGDIARMIFYMATRYEGFDGEPDLEIVDYVLDASDKSPLHGKLSDLLKWHNEDPVDALERQRNDIIYSYQQNRNPYIDHPEYVGSIWGSPSTDPVAPSFTSTPVTGAYVNELYTYNITTTGGEGALVITAVQKPEWLSLTDNGNGTGILTGTPSDVHTGDHQVDLQVSDGISTASQSYVLNVSTKSTGGSTASELFISEYIEGSSYNKALEIANFTGADVDLSAYSIHKQTNGSGSWSTGLLLSGILAHGEVYVIAHSSAASEILAQADLITGATEMIFNGNDAVSLFKSGSLLDIIGVFNDATTFAQDVTMVRKSTVTSPASTYNTAEWDNYSSDTFTYLGSHSLGSTSNELPTVAITSPADNSTFIEGDVISIAAAATDNDGLIAKVVFYEGTNILGEDNSSPYSFDWVNAVAGTYTLTARAYDDQNGSTTSAVVKITVDPVTTNQPPTVSITNPLNGAIFNEGDDILFEASASDQDGSVARVEFYSNGINLGEDLSSPYSITITNAAAGSYNLTAVAFDDLNASATSSSVDITVEAPVSTKSMTSTIYFSTNAKGKNYEGEASIFVTSEGANVTDAYVEITWTNSNGSYLEKQSGYTGGSGILFKSSKMRENDFIITIDQIIKSGYEWDVVNSEVTKSTTSTGRMASIIDPEEQDIVFYPNPFESAGKLKYKTLRPTDVEINIYDLNGKILEAHKYSAESGVYEFSIGKELPKGIYFIQFVTDELVERLRVVKE